MPDLDARILARGLSDEQAVKRLTEEGYNELPTAKRQSILRLILEIARQSMFLLLIACGSLYLVLGDITEALLLLSFVFVVIGITFVQKRKTERALDALRELSSPRALVVRNGRRQRIAGREVVRDDIVLLSEGDRVPADAVLLRSTNVSVDESLLTGESVPVRKVVWDGKLTIGRPGGDDLPFIYSGTMVVRGQAIAQVRATGPRTEIGKIGKALQILEPEGSDLQRQTDRIVKIFAFVGLCLCFFVVVGFGLTRGDWLHGLLAGLTLAMATLPEEFPVVMTIFLALGAWRIAKRKVLTRRMPAVETLGATTVLCVDKTGTITLNRMSVAKVCVEGHVHDVGTDQGSLAENLHQIVEYSILASPSDPFDPMERAMQELGARTLAHTEHLHSDWKLLREYPLTDKLFAMSRVWQSPDGEDYVIAAKGAPETIADLCHFDAARLADLERQIEQMVVHGLRVIGVASAHFRHSALPPTQHDFPFTFLGLLGLADPVRPGVPEAVAECASAGIRVIMITGDYPGTAKNIAQQIGLKPVHHIITGSALDAMDDVELQRRIHTACIFARVVPEQKLRIVNALKANGEVVAMTGDGVNDAPALKAAHIGIAMGGRGTDVARESASMVLLDDNFASIVAAIRMGRRVYDNLKKAIVYIFSVHIPIAGMSLLPVLFKWPLALLPVHIVFLELIIDPACSIVFEAERSEKDVMRRKPRHLKEPLFGRAMVFLGLAQGLGILTMVAGEYALALALGLPAGEARAFAFVNLLIGNLGLIVVNRSWTRSTWATLKTPNPALWWVAGGGVGFLAAALTIPWLRAIFGFATLHPMDYALNMMTALMIILILEGFKFPAVQRWFAAAHKRKKP
ncbi:MAG: cation-translocating P-type ATPase [Patescibacteria group bacterium]|nr:cation-translocating P-type ATPase [Patescibacteria group bacterium]